jgi:hypothetical protein
MGGQDGFASGITLDHENPSIVYLARQIGAVPELDKWVTPDSGTTWDSTAITRGSAKKNCRPCVPRGHKTGGNIELIWLYGDYTTYDNGAWNMAVNAYPFRQPVGTINPVRADALTDKNSLRAHTDGVAFKLVVPSASSLRLFSLDGRLAADFSQELRNKSPGVAFIPFGAFRHANGVFIVIFNDGNRMYTQTLVLTR